MLTSLKNNTRVYLDHQATTPLDPRVEENMRPYQSDVFANPHGTTYRQSILASQAVERARWQVAQCIGVTASEVLFTSGATESNNLALQGLANFGSKRVKVVTQTTEHKSVLDTVSFLNTRGFQIDVVKVKESGVIDLDALNRVVDKDTLVVSVMLVNNETGVTQPIGQIAEICHLRGALLHCDCAQAVGRIPLNVTKLNMDLASFSAHKSYGPKGIGALYVNKNARSKIAPVYFGGGQEQGLRPGTLPVPLCVGMGSAFEIACAEQSAFAVKACRQTDSLRDFLDATDLNVRFNGEKESLAPGCMSVTLKGLPADTLISTWRKLELSTGSACESTKSQSSHVLRAMGLTRAEASSTIRLSVGRFTEDWMIDLIKRHFKAIPELMISQG